MKQLMYIFIAVLALHPRAAQSQDKTYACEYLMHTNKVITVSDPSLKKVTTTDTSLDLPISLSVLYKVITNGNDYFIVFSVQNASFDDQDISAMTNSDTILVNKKKDGLLFFIKKFFAS